MLGGATDSVLDNPSNTPHDWDGMKSAPPLSQQTYTCAEHGNRVSPTVV
jgi:hypothetical protein